MVQATTESPSMLETSTQPIRAYRNTPSTVVLTYLAMYVSTSVPRPFQAISINHLCCHSRWPHRQVKQDVALRQSFEALDIGKSDLVTPPRRFIFGKCADPPSINRLREIFGAETSFGASVNISERFATILMESWVHLGVIWQHL